jgi:hypothetical protein
MFIEVSHESPISILGKSQEYNDYGYALVHLFETHPDYWKYYKHLADDTDVPVLLDNSIFELKKAFDPKKYSEWVDRLQPNYYIVPDVLESAPDTIQQWKNWCRMYDDNTDALRIGVVQGKDWNDLVRCYNFMKDHADYIAISFDYSYYKQTGFVEDDYAQLNLVKYSSGRKRFIRQLIDEGYWCWDKPHHLLGCSLAREFRYYIDNNIYNIKSVDTSNPVVAAIKGYRYNHDQGLSHKPSTLLADLIEHQFTDKQLQDLEYNTTMFKRIINR